MANNELMHYGILGMKWGIRRSEAQLARARGSKKTEVHEDYKRVHNKKSVKSMGDQELRNRINRLQMENQYKDLSSVKSKGEKAVKTFITTAGTITSAIAAYKTYKSFIDPVLKTVGNVKI